MAICFSSGVSDIGVSDIGSFAKFLVVVGCCCACAVFGATSEDCYRLRQV